MKREEVINSALRTWADLNDYMRLANEEQCREILEMEKNGKARKQFIRRIHCRLNKVRAARERAELLEKDNATTKASRN